jgi:Transcriptional regulator, AbiEi antitoxin
MLRSSLPSAFGGTLDRQHDLATRRQVLEGGINDMTVYRRIRAGTWQRVLPGIYLVTPGTLTMEQRRIAAALFAGPDCQLTGLNVLHWYGFNYAPATDRVHILVPHEVRCRSTGFLVVQRTLALDEDARDAGLYRMTSPARAVVDASRATTSRRDVRAIVAEAVQRGFVSPAALDREIRRAARSRTALVRQSLAEVIDGIRFAPEAELREITSRSKVLPPILWNPRLATEDGVELPTPDGWIVQGAIALEVDSSEHHSSVDGWRRTLRRHNVLTQRGAIVLHFTPAEIRAEPGRVLRSIEQTYQNRARLTAQIGVLTRDPS